VSRTRNGALTLVIDPLNGTPNRVAYAMSRAPSLDSAIVALEEREGTTRANVGFVDVESGRHRSRYSASITAIQPWAAVNELGAVIWTDLPSNFRIQTGIEFSIPAAVAYLETLNSDAKEIAYTYIRCTPAFIQTPLRRALHL
jgi:hypothetical protein